MRPLVLLGAVLALIVTAGAPASARSQWSPWFLRGPHNVSQAELAKAFQSEAATRKLFRVSRATVVRSLRTIGLPVTVDELSQFVSSTNSNVRVAKCTPDRVRRVLMGRAHTSGRIAVDYRRRECYPGEQWLEYRRADGHWVAFISLGCGNPIREFVKTASACVPIRITTWATYQRRMSRPVTFKVHVYNPGPGDPEACGAKIAHCFDCGSWPEGRAPAYTLKVTIAGDGYIRLPRSVLGGGGTEIAICSYRERFAYPRTPDRARWLRPRHVAIVLRHGGMPPGKWVVFAKVPKR